MPVRKLLEWSPRSQINITRIRAYIAADNPKAAQSVVDEIAINAAQLRDFPMLGKPWKQGRRMLVLQQFPYLIIYKILPTKIVVLAVANQRMKL